MLDLNGIQAFLQVAHTGSFSAAAEQLRLTQPAVSKRVAALESDLGTRLFDRIGRRIHLTEAGSTLLPRAARILTELDDSRRAVRNLAGRIEGPLRVGTSHHIGLHRLPPVLRNYVALHPEVELDLKFLDSEVILSAVESGEMELGIATLPPTAPEGIECDAVWRDDLVVVCAPASRLARIERLELTHLVRERAILPGEGTYTRRIVQQSLRPFGVELRVTLSTNYLETIKMMVSVGLGWSVLPRRMLEPDLIALDIPELAMSRTLGTVRHRARTLSNAARALMTLLHRQRE
jgi:DNA-binding transcriptional LysR family regulator